jgi:4-hydroxybenzoate polyprenyltransferase
MYTDIATTGWVGRLPEWTVPYVVLARLDRPIGAWLLFLPGLWSFALAAPPTGHTIWLIALFGLGSVLMRAAGCVVNDMWDRDLDRRVTRTARRPLASGALGMRQAATFLILLLLASLLILLQLNRTAQLLGVASLVLIAIYPLAKRVTWWPQAMLGLTFGWGAPMGFAACVGRIDAAAIALYAASFMWIMGYDTIYAHQDREDDALIGVRSTARLFAHSSRRFVGVCYIFCVVLLGVSAWLSGLGWAFYLLSLLPAWLLARQVVTLDITNPASCWALFNANRNVGLLVALAMFIGRLAL